MGPGDKRREGGGARAMQRWRCLGGRDRQRGVMAEYVSMRMRGRACVRMRWRERGGIGEQACVRTCAWTWGSMTTLARRGAAGAADVYGRGHGRAGSPDSSR